MSNPNYSTNDPRGWGGEPRRGAALGRPTICPSGWDGSEVGRLYLRHIRLNSGGYDRNGTYFGLGAPLYWCASADGEVDFMLRASSRIAAKAQILTEHPCATFIR